LPLGFWKDADKTTNKHTNMKLLPGEEMLVASNENKIVLTSHRIQMTESVWGQSYTVSMFLEDISSMEVKYKSYVFFLFIGALSIVAGLYLATQGGESNAMLGGLVIGVIMFALWWFSRRHMVSISSNGGATLDFMVQGMSDEKIEKFLYDVNLAKHQRMNYLHRQ
jgi:hypothetical protein